MRRYALRDDQRERIGGLLPGREGHVGVMAKDDRPFVEAVLRRCRAGIPWRDLPGRFGAWKKVRTRFRRRAKAGVREGIVRHLAGEADDEQAMLDGTAVRARRHGAGAAEKAAGATRRSGAAGGGLGTKIHATVDAPGGPTGFALSPGRAHDLGAPTPCRRTWPRTRRSPTRRSTPRSASSGLSRGPAGRP